MAAKNKVDKADQEDQAYRKSQSGYKGALYGRGSNGRFYLFSADRKSLEGGKGIRPAGKKVSRKRVAGK